MRAPALAAELEDTEPYELEQALLRGIPLDTNASR